MNRRRLKARLAALPADESGVTAVFTGFLMVVALGFVGLGVDVGVGYNARRVAQNAADSAAFSAGVGAMSGANNVADQARAVAARYGLSNGVDGVAVQVNQPPLTGSKAGNGQAVEVIITRPGRRFFSSFFASGATTIRARAVAVAGTAGDACVLALNPNVSAAVLDTGTANVNLQGCSLFANSNNASALMMKGGAIMTAASVGLVGGLDIANNSTLTATGGIRTNQSAMADPYANVEPPPKPAGGCTNLSFGPGTYSVKAGSYCNIDAQSQAVVNFEPGIYFIDGGDLQLRGQSTINAPGVTFVLTGSGSSYGTVHINAGANVNMYAPSSGPTGGLAFFQDRGAPGGVVNKFNGGAVQSIRGAIYFPKQTVNFTGGSSTGGGCTQLLADQIQFAGNSSLEINCAGSGVKTVGSTATALVE